VSEETKETKPSSEEIEERIERTREDLGETVEALAAKTDVKAQAQRKAVEIKQQIEEDPRPWVAGAALVAVVLIVRRRRRR